MRVQVGICSIYFLCLNFHFCLVIYFISVFWFVSCPEIYLWKKIYVVSRLETNCRKSLIQFHAIVGLCWYSVYLNYYFCLVIVISYILYLFLGLAQKCISMEKIYLVNRLETKCRKSLIPFHAIWGVCWYNLDSFWGGRRAGCRRKYPLMCVWVRVRRF